MDLAHGISWVCYRMPRDPTGASHGIPRNFPWDPVESREMPGEIPRVQTCSGRIPLGLRRVPIWNRAESLGLSLVGTSRVNYREVSHDKSHGTP